MIIEVPKYILIYFRVMAILRLYTDFSMKGQSNLFKVSFSLIMAFLITGVVSYPGELAGDGYAMLLAILREVLIGLSIGFAVRLLFAVIQATGEIVGFQTGFGFARMVDPFSSAQVSILEDFLYMLSLMIFFATDAHHIIVRGIYASFKELPLGTATVTSGLFNYFVTASGRIFGLGLKFGAPLVVALFLIELSLGLLSRMIPTMNIFVEGLPVKVFVSLTILSLALSFMVPALGSLFKGIDAEFLKVLRLLA
ncbi:MAG: flagellar biosynthetic protein FliR [Syntrophorhabdales bacterium]